MLEARGRRECHVNDVEHLVSEEGVVDVPGGEAITRCPQRGTYAGRIECVASSGRGSTVWVKRRAVRESRRAVRGRRCAVREGSTACEGECESDKHLRFLASTVHENSTQCVRVRVRSEQRMQTHTHGRDRKRTKGSDTKRNGRGHRQDKRDVPRTQCARKRAHDGTERNKKQADRESAAGIKYTKGRGS